MFQKEPQKYIQAKYFKEKPPKKRPKTAFCPNSIAWARVQNLTQFS